MSDASRSHIPALRFDALTRHFDTLIAWTLNEARFRNRLVDQAGIEPHHRVVDLGCGTGSLALLLKQRVPSAEVVGLDPDAEALRIARGKAEAAGVDVEFRQESAGHAKVPDHSCDRVLSSLVLHHLLPREKRAALRRARHWLRKGGELHVADWGQARSGLLRAAFLGVQLLDGFATTRENIRQGLLPALGDAGFSDATEVAQIPTVYGPLSFYKASRLE